MHTPWISIPKKSDFSIHNLPFGIFSTSNRKPRIGIAVGELILDLKVAAQMNLWPDIDSTIFETENLNDFIALGKKTTNRIRKDIQQTLSDENSPLKSNKEVFVKHLEATMHMPIKVGDYTDFYSSMEHAINVGKMFRGPEKALLPNWKHIPVAYHGRSSSIILSKIPVYRPKGQVLPLKASQPIFQSSNQLDFELETAFIIGMPTQMRQSLSTQEAEKHIFGLVLFNDWSARDIQKWEYVPLGPFLGKNFASSISPWVITLEALQDFKVPTPLQNPKVLPYLQYQGLKSYDIHLEVSIAPKNTPETVVSRSNFRYMYWNMAQQLAHHTVNGCNINIGDMMASGTISGKTPDSYGSMLELTWGGKNPITLQNKIQRTFIQDHDTVIMRGFAENNEKRVGFGEIITEVLPAQF